MDILDFVNQDKVDKKKYTHLINEKKKVEEPQQTDIPSSVFDELEDMLDEYPVKPIETNKIKDEKTTDDEDIDDDNEDDSDDDNPEKKNYNALLTEIENETLNTKPYNLIKEKVDKLELINFICKKLENHETGSSKFFAMPTQDSSIEEINIILGMVKSRLERARYANIFDEIAVRTAGKIEDIFDGTRTIPGFDWSPNYKGLKKTIEIKLKDMKMDTSEIIGKVIEKFNIGPIGKVCLELLPILFFYQHS